MFLDKVLGLLQAEQTQVQEGRRRQEAVWKGEEVDYLPLLLTGGSILERKNSPSDTEALSNAEGSAVSYNLKEQFFDKEKMLYEQLWPALSTLRAGGDALPSVRANLGTGFLASVFGLEEEVFADKMPWLKEHLRKDEIKRLSEESLNPISEKGLIPRAKEYMNFFKERLAGKAAVFLPDTQGPFDLAHLIRGNEIFTDIYDDPDFAHHLMELSTYVYIAATKYLKETIGESLNSGYHGNSLYMGNCGVRCCEDTTTLLSPEIVKEFVAPYIKKALSPFGGGWIHFCGKGNHLLDIFSEIPEVRGINFGNPEYYDPAEILPKLESKGKIYYGSFPRKEKEGMEEYFVRLLKPLHKKGTLLLVFDLPEGEEPSSVLSTWHSIQDRIFFS